MASIRNERNEQRGSIKLTSARKYFGTDGIRGTVGASPITPEFVMHLGYAAGKVLTAAARLGSGQHTGVLIGKDTRISGYMLESALQAGLSAAGVDIYLAGPMPTPAVAYLTRALRLSAGIVISASHNPFEDNGIKFFSAHGNKLPDAVEHAIEAQLELPIATMPSAELGKARRIGDAAGRYIEFCKSTFPTELDLRGIKLVIDCAHGATYHVAGEVFHELGADVVTIGNQPDGLNINDACGAVHPQALQDAVRANCADLGIGFDGDGDRVVMVDAGGRIYDGDELLYVIAAFRHDAGLLAGGVVGTLMTNLGMERALTGLGIPFLRAAVGDRYVLEKLQENNWQIGGESSGHIICLDRHTTGDGIVSALQVLHAVRALNKPLSELVKPVARYPQVLVNVRVTRDFDFRANAVLTDAVQQLERSLSGNGRVLLRASGTEPVIRVMVEGADPARIRKHADELAKAVTLAARASVAESKPEKVHEK
ncbi:MAG: phosphoglucosamine mutase [Betaproteobacteria bacterium]|jgi:phosphoglucosamine mutase|nr:MAG: phosphoglucosamine mutase [Betaproteobacteria bacterium]